MSIPIPSDHVYRERLKSRIIKDENDCWNYSGYIAHTGYGQLNYQHKVWNAHRLSYHLFKGGVPEGKIVCHKCNNRACINPTHLYAGSYSDNAFDAVAAGTRFKGGECNGAATPKLTETDVIAIRGRYESGDKISTIHRDYPHVSYHNVGCVCRRTSWRHI